MKYNDISSANLISIIIPVYNSEKYLQNCINSILKQSYKNFEIILINDGSKDQSSAICLDYCNKNKRINYYSKVNEGVSSARNLGISKACGEYLTFIDSDDYIEKDHLLNFIKFSSAYDWVMQGMRYTTHTGGSVTNYLREELSTEKVIHSEEKNIIIDNLPDIPAFPWVVNKLYKSSIIKNNHLTFKYNISSNEDRIFNLEYSYYISSYIMLPSVTYNYVKNNTSLTHSYISPQKFISTSDELNLLTKKYDFPIAIYLYISRCSLRYYIHALGLCLIISLKKLTFLQRIKIILKILKKITLTDIFKRYKFRAITMCFLEFFIYVNRYFIKKFLSNK